MWCIETIEQFNGLLSLAENRRKVAPTQRNSKPSRSHIIQIKLSSIFDGKTYESVVILLDLAGSECATDHFELDGKERVSEMKKINQSVSAFGSLISSSKKGQFANYRAPKLTHLLKPYLTSNSRTFIRSTVAQERKYFSTSESTLSLASEAIKIHVAKIERNFEKKKNWAKWALSTCNSIKTDIELWAHNISRKLINK